MRAGEMPEGVVRADEVTLYWIPLGAGASLPVVRANGRIYEAVAARRARRQPAPLFHAALTVRSDGAPHIIEMTPAWGTPTGPHGVVSTGPVGLRVLGRSRAFRYEVRCWRDGVVPDLAHAVGGPMLLSGDAAAAARILALAPRAPTPTWGRDELAAGDMWNSNSLVAWLLTAAGVDLTDIAPPGGGRAPGWSAGLVVAGRPGLGLSRGPTPGPPAPR